MFNKKNYLYFFIASFHGRCIFSASKLYDRQRLDRGLKKVGEAIIQDFTCNPLPLFRMFGSKIAKFSAVIASAIPLLIAAIPLLVMARNEIIVQSSSSDSLTSNVEDRHLFFRPDCSCFSLPDGVHAMARQIGLNPKHIIVNSPDGDIIAGASQTFTRNILIVGRPMRTEFLRLNYFAHHEPNIEMNGDERRFVIGHEFAHLAHAHPIKMLIAQTAGSFALRVAIATGKAVIGLSFLACAQRFQLPTNGVLSIIAHFLLQNKWVSIMESLLAIKLSLRYIRKCEKQADIESAVTFNCAAHGISFFKKADAFFRRKYSSLRYFLYTLVDTHPTYAERIAYLRPIAQAQEEAKKKS